MSFILGTWTPPPASRQPAAYSSQPRPKPLHCDGQKFQLVISVLLPCVLRGAVTGDSGVLRTHLHVGVLHGGSSNTETDCVPGCLWGKEVGHQRDPKSPQRGWEGSQVDSVHLTLCRAAGGRRKLHWRREDTQGPRGVKTEPEQGAASCFPARLHRCLSSRWTCGSPRGAVHVFSLRGIFFSFSVPQ